MIVSETGQDLIEALFALLRKILSDSEHKESHDCGGQKTPEKRRIQSLEGPGLILSG
jgi:hypothetical protein